MKTVLFVIAVTFMSTAAYSSDVNATKIVYCTKFGDMSGQVSAFSGFCPLGWIPA